jgi:hypothetical protein
MVGIHAFRVRTYDREPSSMLSYAMSMHAMVC